MLRPILSLALSIAVFAAGVDLIPRLPGADAGKFLSDRGFWIFAIVSLTSLSALAYLLRFRWWDFIAPLVLAMWLIRFDFSDYWTLRIFPSVITPILISAAFAAFIEYRRKHRRSKCSDKEDKSIAQPAA